MRLYKNLVPWKILAMENFGKLGEFKQKVLPTNFTKTFTRSYGVNTRYSRCCLMQVLQDNRHVLHAVNRFN